MQSTDKIINAERQQIEALHASLERDLPNLHSVYNSEEFSNQLDRHVTVITGESNSDPVALQGCFMQVMDLKNNTAECQATMRQVAAAAYTAIHKLRLPSASATAEPPNTSLDCRLRNVQERLAERKQQFAALTEAIRQVISRRMDTLAPEGRPLEALGAARQDTVQTQEVLQQNRDMREQLETLKQSKEVEIAEMREGLTRRDRQIVDLSKQVEAVNRTVEEQARRMNAIQKERDDLQLKVEQPAQAVSTAAAGAAAESSSLLKQAQQQVEELTATTKELHERESNLKREQQHLQTELADAQRTLEVAQEELKSLRPLQGRVREAYDELKHERAVHQDLSNSVQHLEQSLMRTLEEKRELEASLRAAEERAAAFEQQLQTARDDAATLSRRLEVVLARNRELELVVQNQAIYNATNNDSAALRSRITELEQLVAEAQERTFECGESGGGGKGEKSGWSLRKKGDCSRLFVFEEQIHPKNEEKSSHRIITLLVCLACCGQPCAWLFLFLRCWA